MWEERLYIQYMYKYILVYIYIKACNIKLQRLWRFDLK